VSAPIKMGVHEGTDVKSTLDNRGGQRYRLRVDASDGTEAVVSRHRGVTGRSTWCSGTYPVQVGR
jgi:hypothetical protein